MRVISFLVALLALMAVTAVRAEQVGEMMDAQLVDHLDGALFDLPPSAFELTPFEQSMTQQMVAEGEMEAEEAQVLLEQYATPTKQQQPDQPPKPDKKPLLPPFPAPAAPQPVPKPPAKPATPKLKKPTIEEGVQGVPEPPTEPEPKKELPPCPKEEAKKAAFLETEGEQEQESEAEAEAEGEAESEGEVEGEEASEHEQEGESEAEGEAEEDESFLESGAEVEVSAMDPDYNAFIEVEGEDPMSALERDSAALLELQTEADAMAEVAVDALAATEHDATVGVAMGDHASPQQRLEEVETNFDENHERILKRLNMLQARIERHTEAAEAMEESEQE